jgi:hypothetical protein
MLVEKALAKVKGSYQQMLECSTEECISFIAGPETE